MKNSLVAVASAVLMTCGSAFAQATAPQPSVDPAIVEATRQMMTEMKVRDTMLATMQQIEQQIPVQMKTAAAASINANSRMSAEQKAEALKKIDQEVPRAVAHMHAVLADPTVIDDIIAELIPLYAETYTLDEIHQLTAFYASPVGQKMLATMPVLMRRSMEIGNRVMGPRIQKALTQTAQGVVGQGGK